MSERAHWSQGLKPVAIDHVPRWGKMRVGAGGGARSWFNRSLGPADGTRSVPATALAVDRLTGWV